ncbi:MAG: hypothetical protein QG620_158 [Patescibacteria group bacterium]|nr:hypothetical protein [Patescibacteria group bacterium]
MNTPKTAKLILASLVFLSLVFRFSIENSLGTTNNIFLDSDQDGLTDAEERTYGTDPRNRDTDSDSYCDGAEVKAGYDPLKPAPGDRIVSAEITPSEKNDTVSEVLGENTENKNLTQEMAEKLSEITKEIDSENQEVTLEEIQSLIDDALNSGQKEIELPEVTKDDIQIKKQNYSGLSEEEAQERRKEDFSEYIIGVYYIFSSNSPKPITSFSDINKVMSSFTNEIIYALDSKSSSSLDDLSQISEKSLEQLQDVEVPEELVDLHIKALKFAMYAQSLKSNIDSEQDDPLEDIVRLSKIQVYVENLMSFSTEAAMKFEEYGMEYDDGTKEILKKYGLEFENESEEDDEDE